MSALPEPASPEPLAQGAVPQQSAGAFAARAGTVTAFDDFGGWGTVADAHGVERFFHCTTIADGSRTIAVGAAVRFRVVPGAVGRWEAAELTPTT